MNNDLATLDLQEELSEAGISSSENWSKSYVEKGPATIRKFARPRQVEEINLTISASPATALDHWFWDRRGNDVSTATLAFGSVIDRPISRAEALRVARQIIECAEQERIQLAEWEAERGIQWEES